VLVARISRFFTSVARHAVPLGGIFGRDWHPVTAVAVYWLESVLLVLATVTLCALIQRRSSEAAVATAGVHARDVLLFHGGSQLIFGGFFGGILIILVGNGYLPEPFRWSELLQAAEAMLIIVAIGLTIDLWTFNRFTITTVQSRVDACTTRWALFWLLGFFGTMMMMFSGRAMVFFGFFAVLKTVFESWGAVARLFGWKSLKQREAVSRG
jgi:hypothetical protein